MLINYYCYCLPSKERTPIFRDQQITGVNLLRTCVHSHLAAALNNAAAVLISQAIVCKVGSRDDVMGKGENQNIYALFPE